MPRAGTAKQRRARKRARTGTPEQGLLPKLMARLLRLGPRRETGVPPVLRRAAPRKVLFEPLEQRILLSSDPGNLADGVLTKNLTAGDDDVLIEQTGDTLLGGYDIKITVAGESDTPEWMVRIRGE